MAKSKFTKHFQSNLKLLIEEHIASKNLSQNLIVVEELPVTFGNNQNQTSILDIAIINSRDIGYNKTGNPNKVVSIEIEVKNNPIQILSNYNNFKIFVEEKESRLGGLIQLFSDWANISDNQRKEIEQKANEDTKTVEGFLCKITDFTIEDHRTFKQKAEEVITNLSFKRHLNKMIRTVFEVNFK